MREKGLSKILLGYFDEISRAKGFKSQSLVAVEGSWAFWQKRGFAEAKHIENYSGVAAKYMKRKLASAQK